MIKINAIKIEINTDSGLFGAEYEFSKGLNIVRGDNTSGKSSLFQSIIYCLGFEELLGGRNEKTMQSVLKDIVEFPKGSYHRVIQSYIFLEIENEYKKYCTIRRSVLSPNRAPQLVDVYDGNLLTGENKNLPSQPMYIHDKGGASDDIYGFHLYLEKFIGWDLPYVFNKNGDKRKIYIQQIAPSFIIEQKMGWSDFFATMPFYNLTNKEARIIEFILNLDVYENMQIKQNLLTSKRLLDDSWGQLYKSFIRFAERGGGKLSNIETKPIIINDINQISILLSYNQKDLSIPDYIETQKDLLNKLENQLIPKISDRTKSNEQKIDFLTESINAVTLNYELLSEEVTFDKDKLNRYKLQLQSLKEDLRKNKGAQKVKKLGAEINSTMAIDLCPTCSQPIKDSLLPSDIEQNPMLIEENIKFIEAQIKMINVYIDGLGFNVSEKEERLNRIRLNLNNKRQQLREIKKELISDDRLPSELEIENKLNIKKRIEFYSKYLEEFDDLKDELKQLSKKYENLLKAEEKLPRDFYSPLDRAKLSTLEADFKKLLTIFDYKSKSNDFISISLDNYLPVAQKQFGDDLTYNLRFDSSASDFIRCIWAYTCSLYLTSLKYSANHPKLLIFDEPKQQDISLYHFSSFLTELASYKDAQTILFASFENSDDSYLQATKDLDFHLIYIDKKLIRPIE